jgi:argininosuccinate lyase
VEEALLALDAAAVLLSHYKLNPEAIAAKMDSAMLAMDLADVLTATGLPFRDAHGLAGAVVLDAERQGRSLSDYTLQDLKAVASQFPDDFTMPDFDASVRRKRTVGSTHPERVKENIEKAKKLLNMP